MLKVSRTLFFCMVILAVCLVALYLYKRATAVEPVEGFSQIEQYVLNSDANVYDDFYASVYDELFYSEKKTNYVVQCVLDTMCRDASDVSGVARAAAAATDRCLAKKDTVILDAGCGTGTLLKQLKARDFQQIYGIDKSRAMSSVAREAAAAAEIKQEDMLKPLTYDENTFHYIVCINTIYELRDTEKRDFFANVYKWLSVGGYFILHAVSRKKFIETNAGGEKNKVEKKFRGAKYYLLYETSTKNENKLTMTEGFVDEKTSHIRQNEKTLYLMELNKLKEMVVAAGLKYHSVVSMGGDEGYEFLLIFYK